jgi:hypothetical protein
MSFTDAAGIDIDPDGDSTRASLAKPSALTGASSRPCSAEP